jgi:hypothetical protein
MWWNTRFFGIIKPNSNYLCLYSIAKRVELQYLILKDSLEMSFHGTMHTICSKSHIVDLGLKNETSYICYEYKFDLFFKCNLTLIIL